MWAKHIKSWITVLWLFFFVVLLCALWERFTSPSVEPQGTQLVYNPAPALAKIQPSVVSLWATRKKGREMQIGAIGCGLIVDSRGYVLTSATLTEDIESLYVIDRKDKRYEANVITTDKITRLILLKIDPGSTTAREGFEAAHLADSEQIRKGDGVIALGGRMTPSSWELTTRTGRITKRRQSLVVKGTAGEPPPNAKRCVWGPQEIEISGFAPNRCIADFGKCRWPIGQPARRSCRTRAALCSAS